MWFFLPVAFALVAAQAANVLSTELSPRHGIWVLTGLAFGSTTALFAALLAPAVAFAMNVGKLVGLGWCRGYSARGHAAPWPIGLTALLALMFGVRRCLRVVKSHRLLMSEAPSEELIVLLRSNESIAYAVPGRPGHIVVSDALLGLLDETGRQVLFAHEQAHLRQHHHRFLFIGNIAAALFAPLKLLSRHIEFATERCADEAAVVAVGDRRKVATAIAAAALGQSSQTVSLALAQLGVTGRVRALIAVRPPTLRWRAGVVLAVLLGLLVNVVGSMVELHHLFLAGLHFCGL